MGSSPRELLDEALGQGAPPLRLRRAHQPGAGEPREIVSDARETVEEAREGGGEGVLAQQRTQHRDCLLYTSPSPRDGLLSRMPSSA